MTERPAGSTISTANCPNCGGSLFPGDRFCGGCGTPLARCRSCEGPLVPGDRFCAKCGTPNVAGSAPTATPTRAAESSYSPWTQVQERLRSATIGEFEIRRELGRGGMAAVFLAHEIALNRQVAIKVMSPQLLTGEGMVDRFLQEAVTVANMSHPNIVTIHAVRQLEDLYYFVMKFVRGRSLENILRATGPLPVPLVRALLFQVGSALAYAHRRGVVHRDIKPANILVDDEGNAIVTDFGIAKVAESQMHTQTGTMVGTPAYMSPEQCRGVDITWASDQYSLGVVAYEMLTGQTPFSGSIFAIVHAHIEGEAPAITDLRPDCDPDLAAAVMRMLAKSAADRWATMSHALAALGAQPLSEGDPIKEDLARLASPSATLMGELPPSPLSPIPRTASPTPARSVAAIGSVAITPPPPELMVGDTHELRATVRDAHGGSIPGQPVKWSSTDPEIASVDARGRITAVAPGSISIRAACGGAEGKVAVTVIPLPVAAVNISMPPAMYVGDRVQLSATPQDKRGRAVSSPVRWGSADESVASVSPAGVLDAKKPGSARILAEVEGVQASAVVEVAHAAVATLQLSRPPASVSAGETFTLTATALGARSEPLVGREMRWSSSDPGVATVSDAGAVTAIRAGSTTITVSSEGKSARISITVKEAAVASVQLLDAPAIATAGEKYPLRVLAFDAQGFPLERAAEWKSSDRAVANITSNGTLVARKAGAVTITATVGGIADAARIEIAAPAGAATAAGAAASALAGSGAGAPAATSEPAGSAGVRRSSVAEMPAAPPRRSRALLVGVPVLLLLAAGGWFATHRSAAVPAAASTAADSSLASGDGGAAPAAPAAAAPSVILSSPPVPVRAGQSFTLVASLLTPANGQLTERQARWTSSDPSVATVGATTGLVTAKRAGLTHVTAEIDGHVRQVDVRVDAAQVAAAPGAASDAPASVALGASRPVRVGESERLTARVLTAGGSTLKGERIAWSSDDPSIASVDPRTGELKGASVGSANITARSGSLSASVSVTVMPPSVGSITVGSIGTLAPGAHARASVTVRDTRGSSMDGAAVAWSSSDPDVASVSPSGSITAHGAGTATITASAEGKTGSTSVTVTAPAPAIVTAQQQTPPPTPPAGETAGAGSAASTDAGDEKAALAQIQAAVAAYVQSLRSADVARVSALWTPDKKGLQSLTDKMRDNSAKLGVDDPHYSAPKLRGDQASADFSVSFSWSGSFGARREKTGAFRAELQRDGSGWHIVSARLTNNPF